MDSAPGIVSKKILSYLRSSGFSPILSSRRYIVSHFVFRSVIRFELIFLKVVRTMFRFFFFFFLHLVSQLFKHHRKDYLFSIILLLLLCQKSVDYIFRRVCLWTLCSVSLIFLSVLSPITHCLDYSSFIVSLEVALCQSSNFVLLQHCVGYSGSFASPYKL